MFNEVLKFNNDTISIAELNYLSIKKIAEYLDIKTEIIKTSTIYNNSDLKAQDRIIDICIKEKANTYINPIGGVDLYNKSDFKNANIDLYFIKTDEIKYKQFTEEFVPWLSILDVMMFNSVEEIKIMLNKYTLV